MQVDGTNLRMLQYNLFLRPYPIENPGLGDFKDLRHLIFINKVLVPKTYDIIFLQEVWDGPQISNHIYNHRKRRIIKSAIDNGYHVCGHGPDSRVWRGKLIDGGCLILSKFPPIAMNKHIFNATCNVDALASKGVIHALLKISDNHNVDVFCTHLQSSYKYVSSEKTRKIQQLQLEELHDFVVDCVNDRSIAIIAGDFNIDSIQNDITREYDNMIDIMKGLYFDEVRDLLVESLNKHPETTVGYKWNKKTGKEIVDCTYLIDNMGYNPAKEFVRGCRLDYVLVLETWEADEKLYNNNTRVEKFYMSDLRESNDIDFLSDHFGIVSEIILK